MPPTPVSLTQVEQRPLVQWAEFSGRIEACESVEIKPRISGYITQVHFKAGALVKKGELLFTIDQRRFQTRLRAAKAGVAKAVAVEASARSEQARSEALLAAKAISPEQAEARQSAWLQAQADLELARAQEQSAAIELEHCEVRAPLAGRMGRALSTEGNHVTEGQSTLSTLVSVNPIFAYADMDEASLLRLKSLQQHKTILTDKEGRIPVELQLADEQGHPHQGHLESLDNRVDGATGAMSLRALFANPDERLTPGLFVRLRLPMSQRQPTLLIEETAIFTDQSSKYVLGIDESQKPPLCTYRPVQLGPALEGKRIVRQGLKAGEKVIIGAQGRLPRAGSPVQPLDAKTPAVEAAAPAKPKAH
jgi:RND family efflux transporter MFP subunit